MTTRGYSSYAKPSKATERCQMGGNQCALKHSSHDLFRGKSFHVPVCMDVPIPILPTQLGVAPPIRPTDKIIYRHDGSFPSASARANSPSKCCALRTVRPSCFGGRMYPSLQRYW